MANEWEMKMGKRKAKAVSAPGSAGSQMKNQQVRRLATGDTADYQSALRKE